MGQDLHPEEEKRTGPSEVEFSEEREEETEESWARQEGTIASTAEEDQEQEDSQAALREVGQESHPEEGKRTEPSEVESTEEREEEETEESRERPAGTSYQDTTQD